MKRTTLLITALAVLVTVLAAVCGGSGDQAGSSSGKGEKTYSPNISPADFVSEVDNKYFPLEPGTKYVYEGKTEEGSERVEVTVTRDTKQVMGIECTVRRDRVFVNGELVEDTRDWHAQDKEGNVWYLGEDVKDYENGKVVSTKGSWQAGVDGAKPARIMPADPKVGEIYHQEYSPGKAMDKGKVLSLNESTTVPYGSFDNVLKTKDWNPLAPGGSVQHKYYAPGTGLILEVAVTGTKETVRLVDVEKG
jgi:hypothetical protein